MDQVVTPCHILQKTSSHVQQQPTNAAQASEHPSSFLPWLADLTG